VFWDLDPKILCRNHLLGEHNEIHSIWTILTENRKGYSRHPETQRWAGCLAALYRRHSAIAEEMERRGYRHTSFLDKEYATGRNTQVKFVNTIDEQRALIRQKGCPCQS
jgi:hypothetical protein